jgi:hypothetical protein
LYKSSSFDKNNDETPKQDNLDSLRLELKELKTIVHKHELRIIDLESKLAEKV